MHIHFASFIVIGGHSKMPLYAKACTCKLHLTTLSTWLFAKYFHLNFCEQRLKFFRICVFCGTTENQGKSVKPDNLALVSLLKKFILPQTAQRALIKCCDSGKVALDAHMIKYFNILC